jgi:triphosphatase
LLAELRWVTRELDRARNIDVLLVRVTEANAQVPLQIARAHAYTTVSAALVSSRLRTLMLDLVEWITIGSWRTERSNHLVDHKLGTFAVVALDACRRDVQRRGRHWKRLDDKGRHRLRIQAKKLRYAVDFFGMLFPNKKAALRHQPFLEALRALQTHLGDMNDRVVGAALLAELGLPGVTVGNTGKGTLRKSSSILKDARAVYDTLIHLKPFWR